MTKPGSGGLRLQHEDWTAMLQDHLHTNISQIFVGVFFKDAELYVSLQGIQAVQWAARIPRIVEL